MSKGLKVAVQSGGVSRMLREPGLGENSAFFPHGSLGQDTFSFAWFASKKGMSKILGQTCQFQVAVLVGVPAMVSVADMLRWKLPPILIMCVLLLRFGTPDYTPDTLDFVEVFCGKAEISKALRRVSRLFLLINAFHFVFETIPVHRILHGTF